MGFMDPPEGPQGGESQTAAPAQDRPSAQDFEAESKGRTTVRAVRGHRVVPSNPDLPIVDSNGVTMGADEADSVVEEFPDYAYIDENGGE